MQTWRNFCAVGTELGSPERMCIEKWIFLGDVVGMMLDQKTDNADHIWEDKHSLTGPNHQRYEEGSINETMFALTCFMDSVGWVFDVFIQVDVNRDNIWFCIIKGRILSRLARDRFRGCKFLIYRIGRVLPWQILEANFQPGRNLSLIACIDTRTWVYLFKSRVWFEEMLLHT